MMDPSLYETAEMASMFVRDDEVVASNVNFPMADSLIDEQRDQNFYYINDVMEPSEFAGIPIGLSSPMSNSTTASESVQASLDSDLLVTVEDPAGTLSSSYFELPFTYLPSIGRDIVEKLVGLGELPDSIRLDSLDIRGSNEFVEIFAEDDDLPGMYTVNVTPLMVRSSGYTNPSDSYPGVQFPMDADEVNPSQLYPQNDEPMAI